MDELREGRHLYDRRTLLAGGAALIGGSLLAACSSSSSSPPPSTTATTTTRPITPVTAADWSSLAASLTGSLVLPSNPSYPTDVELYNAKFTNLDPQGIAYCASPDDVARCLQFVQAHGLDVTSRAGGHSYGGYSSTSGLVIDVTQMSTITLSGSTATIGAGARLIDVYNALGNQGVLLPGGSCPTVGIAGLALGGGLGVFGRKYGLLSDAMEGVSVVTADGRMLHADAQKNADLFWASRGGGGGNFAVATSFEFTTWPIPELTLFTLQFPFAAAADVLGSWQHWIASQPDELWSNCLMLSNGPPNGGATAQVSGVFCGSQSTLSGLLSSLLSAIGTSPTSQNLFGSGYLAAMEYEGGCSGLSVAACHEPSQNPAGVLQRSSFSAKSGYLASPMSASQLDQAIAAVNELVSNVPQANGGLAFDSYGGVINTVSPTSTAFCHRDKLCSIQASATWPNGASTSIVDACNQWLEQVAAPVLPPSQGAYVNYIDPTLEGWETAYYGDNFDRLVSVKAAYDPDDLFRFAQGIPVST